MKREIFILCCSIISISCTSVKHDANVPNFELKSKYLTNDSIKFWETYSNVLNYKCRGMYFSSNGVCDEYDVDSNRKRIVRFYDDIIVNKPLHYKISNDSLFIYVDGCFLEHCKIQRYKIVKLTHDILIVQRTFQKEETISGTLETIVQSYSPAKDQHTKPKFWYELYPHDKSKWPYGTY